MAYSVRRLNDELRVIVIALSPSRNLDINLPMRERWVIIPCEEP